ncbi:50S ribosomal protein L11 methyltransferase [Candidatus Vallotia tarda]|uniref:Ribosomal protein L11 methyltransferase n=1 Tax=Candidatus Vallotiella hemipterorum TaxID=1177213 RepID=A0A916JST1_9BURK|nr:50S ribosomal protein L11 methyltransferase [Candidatus Vallotia tarda]CAG7599636.1 Ribosomal protein L11 methyltransferase [Candidatus Vallotia tarda]
MNYREIILEIDRDNTEALSNALLELGVLSVCIEDADAEMPHEQALFSESGFVTDQIAWMRSRVISMLRPQQDPAVLLAAAANKASLPTCPVFTTRDLPEQDWVRFMQSYIEPIHIGHRIWVMPSWNNTQKKDAIVLELDPGLAFGTGSHPTTRLCMEWIEQHVRDGDSLLDYGCGSGILAILAFKCGASPVVGIDTDPQAVELAQLNSERNHVRISYGLPCECHENELDVVIANILANPLKLMAPMLTSRVKPGGRLVLSGILTCQVDSVVAAYTGHIELAVWRECNGWVCLAGRRPTIN